MLMDVSPIAILRYLLDNIPQEGAASKDDPVVRQAILDVHGKTCFYSGRQITKTFHVDHIWPTVNGGPDNIYNYVPSDKPLNERKNDGSDHIAAIGALCMARHLAPRVLKRIQELRWESEHPFEGIGEDQFLHVLHAFNQCGRHESLDLSTSKALGSRRILTGERLFVAINALVEIPVRIQHAMAASAQSWIRERIANRPNIDVETTQILARDSSGSIRRIIASRTDVGPEIIQTLAWDPDTNTRVAIARRDDIDVPTIDILLTDPVPEIRCMAIEKLTSKEPDRLTNLSRELLMAEHPIVQAYAEYGMGRDLCSLIDEDLEYIDKEALAKAEACGAFKYNWRCMDRSYYLPNWPLIILGFSRWPGILAITGRAMKNRGFAEEQIRLRTERLSNAGKKRFIETAVAQIGQMSNESHYVHSYEDWLCSIVEAKICL